MLTRSLVAIALLVVPSAVAMGAMDARFEFVLHENDLIALRFNLTGASDLKYGGPVEFCMNVVDAPPESRFAWVRDGHIFAASFLIEDGRVAVPGASPTAILVEPSVGARGVSPGAAPVWNGEDCRVGIHGAGGGAWRASRQVTTVLLVKNPTVYWNVTVAASYGVASYDIAWSKGRILNSSEWNGGAFVGTNGFEGPALGVTSQRSHFARDGISMFMDGAQGPKGLKEYGCQLNGSDCPAAVYGADDEGRIFLHQNDGSGDWRHTLVEAAFERGDVSLVEAPLPDDNYVDGNVPLPS